MGPRNAYKNMVDNVVSPITCIIMNHKNQLKQMANVAMFRAGESRHSTADVVITAGWCT
jgi:hypothetical protein